MEAYSEKDNVSNGNRQSATPIYTQYQAYLLRLWQETPHTPWRISLQSTTTGQRHGFANLESMFAFLQAQTERVTQSEDDEIQVTNDK